MEVTKLAEKGIKIKSKAAIFGVNPIGGKAKNIVDAVLLLNRNIPFSQVNVEENPITFNGPGEYEVKGVKFTGLGKGEEVAYIGKIDNIDTFVLAASSAIKSKDILKDCQVAIIDADMVLEESVVAALNADVVLLYGEHAEAIAKNLGKTPNKTSKYAVTREKIPSEMEVIILE